MRLDIRDAGRWRLPKLTYTNYRKEFPNMSQGAFAKWFSFERFWGGRIWSFCIRHHEISLDFRLSWLSDMAFGSPSKSDRQAVQGAEDALTGEKQ